jgi:hypothetical protein
LIVANQDWQRIVSAPDWGERVAESLRRYFVDGGHLMEPCTLVSVTHEVDPDGMPVLLAVYDHSFWPERTGLRRRLDGAPLVALEGELPEFQKAADIAYTEMSEPLGRVHDILVEQDGVWWWGDGYPELPPDPNAPWFASKPNARWQGIDEHWTVAGPDEPTCESLAAAHGPRLERPTVLMPPVPVRCVRRQGHSGVHVSDAFQPPRPGNEVLAWD